MERQWKGSGKAAERPRKGQGKAVETPWKGSGKGPWTTCSSSSSSSARPELAATTVAALSSQRRFVSERKAEKAVDQRRGNPAPCRDRLCGFAHLGIGQPVQRRRTPALQALRNRERRHKGKSLAERRRKRKGKAVSRSLVRQHRKERRCRPLPHAAAQRAKAVPQMISR